MVASLAGPGLGLQLPQYLYPSELSSQPYDTPTNYYMIPPGATLSIPRGTWWIGVGPYSMLQYLDPVTGIWRGLRTARQQNKPIMSDGFNYRVVNLTGCPVAGVVTNAGSGYVQASTTITAGGSGGSLWLPIVGGKLITPVIAAAGKNFSVQPLVFIPAPPNPGVQATAYATLSSGTVGGVTLNDVGAGYASGATITGLMLPSPTDPNISTITPGTVTFTVGGAGSLMAALCTNPGAPLSGATAPTLTVAGVGSSGAVTAKVLQSIVSTSITAGGTGYGNALNSVLMSGGGGNSSTDAVSNPTISHKGFIPRAAMGIATSNAGGTITATTMYDGGLFFEAPGVIVIPSNQLDPTTAATLAFTMGGVNDMVQIISDKT